MGVLDTILDAVGLQRVADSGGVWNPRTGAAGGVKITETRPDAPAWLAPEEIDWLTVSDGLCRRLVYGPVEDAMGRGWRTDEDGERDATADLDARLDLEARVAEVWSSARQYGGAWLWLVTDDGEPLSAPLPSGEHQIEAVHVIDQREARPLEWDASARSGKFTRPAVLDVTLRREESAALVGAVHKALVGPVHTSRMVYVPGLPLARSQPSPPGRRGYDLAVPEAYWTALRDLLLEHASSAVLTVEKSMPWLRLAKREGASAAGAMSFRAAMQEWARMRTAWGTTVLADGDEVGRLDANLTGLRDVVLSGYERVAAIEGIPLSSLIGQAPAGLSTDDESGRRTYDRYIGRGRRLVAERVIRRVYEVERGPARREIVWPSIDRPTDTEAAALTRARADTAKILVEIGAADSVDVRRQFGAPDIADVPPLGEADEDLDLGPDDDDVDEAAADAETYAVPAGARNNARMVLRWRREHPDEIRGMTEVGWARAEQLASQARVGRETVAAMSGFARHRESYEAARRRDPSKPWTEAAIVAWLGWGGTTGIEWARRITGADGG
jgi:hypothetical protein